MPGDDGSYCLLDETVGDTVGDIVWKDASPTGVMVPQAYFAVLFWFVLLIYIL